MSTQACCAATEGHGDSGESASAQTISLRTVSAMAQAVEEVARVSCSFISTWQSDNAPLTVAEKTGLFRMLQEYQDFLGQKNGATDLEVADHITVKATGLLQRTTRELQARVGDFNSPRKASAREEISSSKAKQTDELVPVEGNIGGGRNTASCLVEETPPDVQKSIDSRAASRCESSTSGRAPAAHEKRTHVWREPVKVTSDQFNSSVDVCHATSREELPETDDGEQDAREARDRECGGISSPSGEPCANGTTAAYPPSSKAPTNGDYDSQQERTSGKHQRCTDHVVRTQCITEEPTDTDEEDDVVEALRKEVADLRAFKKRMLRTSSLAPLASPSVATPSPGARNEFDDMMEKALERNPISIHDILQEIRAARERLHASSVEKHATRVRTRPLLVQLLDKSNAAVDQIISTVAIELEKKAKSILHTELAQSPRSPPLRGVVDNTALAMTGQLFLELLVDIGELRKRLNYYTQSSLLHKRKIRKRIRLERFMEGYPIINDTGHHGPDSGVGEPPRKGTERKSVRHALRTLREKGKSKLLHLRERVLASRTERRRARAEEKQFRKQQQDLESAFAGGVSKGLLAQIFEAHEEDVDVDSSRSKGSPAQGQSRSASKTSRSARRSRVRFADAPVLRPGLFRSGRSRRYKAERASSQDRTVGGPVRTRDSGDHSDSSDTEEEPEAGGRLATSSLRVRIPDDEPGAVASATHGPVYGDV